MSLPTQITHYFEADYGPFRNICDLTPQEADEIVRTERSARTGFNRFAMGPEFLAWRREADDLLIRAYSEKFGHPPEGRPYFALLGSFDKTLTMFREGRKIAIDLSEFSEHELTFIYPDHAHLVTYYGSNAPALFYQPPPGWNRQSFWGRLFTIRELRLEFSRLGIDRMIEAHKERDGWAGCYVEAHIWRRSLGNSPRTPISGTLDSTSSESPQ